MNDCISRKAAINAICRDWCNRDYCGDCFFHGAKQAIDVLKALPDADVQPVRHGQFVGVSYDGYADGNPLFYECKCSECGYIFDDEELTFNYCPNCGADMRGEQYETD